MYATVMLVYATPKVHIHSLHTEVVEGPRDHRGVGSSRYNKSIDDLTFKWR